MTLAPDRVQAPQAAAEFGVAVLGSAWHAGDLTQPLITGPVKVQVVLGMWAPGQPDREVEDVR